MNAHPDEQLLSRCLLNEATDQDHAHLQTCAPCRLALDRSQHALWAFRGSVREWSAHESSASVRPAQPAALLLTGMLASRWSVALLVLISVLGVKLSLRPHPAAPGFSEPEADAALLDHVRTDVARRVPIGMESLVVPGSALERSSPERSENETLP